MQKEYKSFSAWCQLVYHHESVRGEGISGIRTCRSERRGVCIVKVFVQYKDGSNIWKALESDEGRK